MEIEGLIGFFLSSWVVCLYVCGFSDGRSKLETIEVMTTTIFMKERQRHESLVSIS